ncbi:porin [Aquabacterium sp.]|uniref:porin n=1 Tax=Aquabacterium sp. TaxID=1872578 RepID=UPI0024881F0F|nr:porin [Aquabacterium sp.]MDI1257683.1 porin [Aquabacterium sp.]
MFAKKNLVAAAALMALVGAAQADVKVYGSLDLSVGSFEAAHPQGASDRTTEVSSGNMMTSFLGFSGSEDLGGGLKAEFAIESFLAPDTGSTTTVANKAGGFWSRGSFVALTGGFGKVALGQYDNPLFTSGYTYNPFGSSMAFSPTMRHFYYNQSAIAQSVGGTSFDTGFVNSITYETPNMGGFSATAQFSPKESTSASNPAGGNSYAVSATYAAGPFAASLTYVKSGIAVAYDADEKVIGFGTSYDFGVLKAFGQYTQIKQESGIANKDRIYQVGVSVPVTEKGSILASFGKQQNKLEAGGAKENDTIVSVGYDHFLSKRTDVYAVFSNNQHTALKSGQTFAFGIKHAF